MKHSPTTTSGFANNRSMTFHSDASKMTLRISPWLKTVSGTPAFLEQVPNLINSGQLAQGQLPPAQQHHIVYGSAILADSTQPDAARDFLTFIADPSREAQWKATGFEIVGKGN